MAFIIPYSIIFDDVDAGDALTMNDFLIKAVALSLRVCSTNFLPSFVIFQAVPAVNVQYVNDSVKQVREIDISVAVATSSGLITPIVTKADSRGLKDIATTVRVLIHCRLHSCILILGTG